MERFFSSMPQFTGYKTQIPFPGERNKQAHKLLGPISESKKKIIIFYTGFAPKNYFRKWNISHRKTENEVAYKNT